MIKFLICFLLILISIISCKDNESNTILLETFDKSAKNNMSVLNKSESKLNHTNSLIDYNKIDIVIFIIFYLIGNIFGGIIK